MRLPREPRLWMMKQVKENESGWEGTADGKGTTWITSGGYLSLDGEI